MINYHVKLRFKSILFTSLLLLSTIVLQAQNDNIKVTITRNDISIKEAFQEIEKQTKMFVAYNQTKLNDSQRISLNEIDKPLAAVLSVILKDTEFEYELKKDHIMIVPKKTIQETKMKIKGQVLGEDKEPIIGSSISIKGTTSGTLTDIEGNFEILMAIGETLRISYLGYHPQDIAIKDGTPLTITLVEDSKILDEVVVTALGIKREEKALSYNVQQVKNDELTTVKNANFMNSLAGKVAGVQINSSSAGPGSAAKVVMRGQKSIALSNNALYVIDGIPMNNYAMQGKADEESSITTMATTDSAADINPDDIESLSVLTGPSAAALYGYEGANGVVLITTKKGKAGKTSLTYSHSSTFSNPFVMPEFQNTYGNVKKSNYSWGEVTDRRYNPEKFFNTGTNIVNSLSFSTGSEKSQTYFSIAANNAAGILPNNDYDRLNFNFRNTTKFLGDKLVLDASLSYIIQNSLNMTSQGQYFNPLPALYLFPRNEDFEEVQLYERYDSSREVDGQYWPYGDQGLSLQNPYWIMHRMNRESKRKRYMLSASLQYNITDWLNVTGRVNVDNTNVRNTDKRYAGTYTTFAGKKGRYRTGDRDEEQLYADVLATLNKRVDKFSFNLNLGGSMKERKMDERSIEGDLKKVTNWFTVENMDRSVGTFKLNDDGLRHQVHSIFLNAEVGYNNFLYLTLTGRNDWDSSLKGSLSKERSFFYPSVGLSGLISEVVTLPSWFTYLKGRLSYTSVGTSYDPYLTREYYFYDEQTDQYELGKDYPNRHLKPEITDSFEAGIDMRFLNGDLSLEGTYYWSDTRNQTIRAKLASGGSGYEYILVQAGSVQNSGIELALGYNHQWGNFAWTSNYTFTYNKNKVKKLIKGVNDMEGNPLEFDKFRVATLGSAGSPEIWLTEGGSMGDIYATSDFTRDYNGHIHLDVNKQLPSMQNINEFDNFRKVGSLLPDYHMGWRNSFSYKGIRLNIMFGGRFGGNVVSNTQAILDRYGVSKHSARLREAGGVRIAGRDISAQDYLGIIGEGTGKSDFYVYSATNIRLQELSLEYTIPRKWVNNIADVTVGFVGNNLAMIYNKAPFDPEVTPSATSNFYQGVDYFMQPSLRNIGFSLKVQF